MFVYVEHILYSLKELLENHYNDYYLQAHNNANIIYESILDRPDRKLEYTSQIDAFYVGDNPNLIDNYVRNYIMIYPITAYELGVSNAAVTNAKRSLHVNLELVVGDEDPDVAFRILLRHVGALQEFLLQYQDFLPEIVIDMNIKSYQFYNTILAGNVYTRAVRYTLILHYISGQYEIQ